MIRAVLVLLMLVSLTFSSSQLSAQVVFQDDFNAENGGVGAAAYNGFAQWTVSDGSVDIIGNGFFDFYPGNGLYVDLDGATADAGKLTSTPIALSAGTYMLKFALGYAGGFGNDQFALTLGPHYSEVFAKTGTEDMSVLHPITRSIVVGGPGLESIVFDHAGGDNFGLVIDNVSLELVPEPSTLVLLALGGFCGLRRK